METESSTLASQAQSTAAVMRLDQQFRNGLGWFYWIAALSLINTVLLRTGSDWNFIVGLGITQIIDVIALEAAKSASENAAQIIYNVGVVLVMATTGLFALFGLLGRKGYQVIAIIGTVLYALDTLIFILVGDIPSIAFHVLGVWGLVSGIKAYRQLQKIENSQLILESIRPAPSATDDFHRNDPATPRDAKYWRRLAILAIILFLPLICFLVLFFGLN
ncbi:MAG: hypothetical protein OT477_13210 [Chloroflexi bacterium]|nr:hypothetical protein [Chloroflexota bacterium]